MFFVNNTIQATPVRPGLQYAGLAALLWLLSACAQPLLPDERESLITHIHEDGSKMFIYRLDHRDPAKPRTFIEFRDERIGDDYMKEPLADSAEQNQIRAERRFRSLSKSRISRSEFCRDGYFTLEEKIGTASSLLRGECREAATENDRKNFPNHHSATFSSSRSADER